MNRTFKLTGCILLAIVSMHCKGAVDSWPHWRGPSRNGVATATGLPTTWSQTENVAWATELPAWAGSTPVVWGDHVFVMSAAKSEPKPEAEAKEEEAESAEDDRRGRRRRGRGPRRDPGGSALLLFAIARADGTVLWQRELDSGNRLHLKHNEASPSPVTDGNHVWALTGTGVLTAFDMNGNEIWRSNLQEEFGAFGLNFGYASSPLLHDGKLFLQVLHGHRTDDPSYIVALDARTGETLWRQERETDALAESPDAYTTPALVEVEGVPQIVISGADYVTAHDPQTGAELWRTAGLNPEKRKNYRVVGSPFVVDGVIYAPTRKRPLLALHPGGELLWKFEGDAAPDVPTPVSDGTYFYIVDDKGLASCLDAKTGETVWGPERTTEGIVSSSPILADGKIYIVNENAVTTVLAAGPEFEILATNELDGSYTLSSPIAVGSQLLIRTGTHLYCIDAGTG
jgi:outer membrane protein assembly factor BamB